MNELSDRLKQARQNAGYDTAEDACHAFGWKPPTYRSHENGSRVPKRATLERYARALRVSYAWLLMGDQISGAVISHPLGIDVVGYVQAGYWLEVDEVVDEPLGRVNAIQDDRFPDAKLVAYQVKGDSFDQYIREDGYVVCVPWADTGLELKSGMPVVVERRKAGGLFREMTLKEVDISGGRVRLVPRSNNPTWKPVEITKEDGTELDVVALVIAFVQPSSW